jgi:hypothetical protein
MPLRMHIETIPHESQRYPTVGDYWLDESGVEQIRVSEMMDWRYEVLVAIHEIIEMALIRHRGIAEEGITEFDIRFEQNKDRGLVTGEPVWSKNSVAALSLLPTPHVSSRTSTFRPTVLGTPPARRWGK